MDKPKVLMTKQDDGWLVAVFENADAAFARVSVFFKDRGDRPAGMMVSVCEPGNLAKEVSV